MSTQKSPERLVFFTDAVVAIAITLLVLPLVDAVPDAVSHHESASHLISNNSTGIYSFLLSFAVIARLWLTHHGLFEHVKAYTHPLMLWNMAWLLTIVALPFPTEMIGAFSNSQFTSGLYIGIIFISSCCQTGLTLTIRRSPEIMDAANPIEDSFVFVAVGMMVAFGVGFLLAALVPGVRYFGLLLVLVPAQLARLRRWRAAA